MFPLTNSLSLSCDKLSITWEPTSDKEMDALIKLFNIGVTPPSPKRMGYRYYKYITVNHNTVSLSADPRYTNAKFFRIEFNPNFVNPKYLSVELDKIISDFYDILILEGTVTRVDLAFDFTNINFDSHGFSKAFAKQVRIMPGETYETLKSLPAGVVFRKKLRNRIKYKPARKIIIYTGVMLDSVKQELLHLSTDNEYRQAINRLYQNSQIVATKQYETFYYGTRKSECYICIYDKNKQMSVKNQTPYSSSMNRYRVEFSIRDSFKLDQLSVIATKHLPKLTVCKYPVSLDPSDSKFTSFLDECRMHSIYFTLNDLSNYMKGKYFKRLNFVPFTDFVGPSLHDGLIKLLKYLLV